MINLSLLGIELDLELDPSPDLFMVQSKTGPGPTYSQFCQKTKSVIYIIRGFGSSFLIALNYNWA